MSTPASSLTFCAQIMKTVTKSKSAFWRTNTKFLKWLIVLTRRNRHLRNMFLLSNIILQETVNAWIDLAPLLIIQTIFVNRLLTREINPKEELVAAAF